ncbi:hypothetical protein CPB85DRAFT_1432124 [Mucidula mucida]|nr:hypothetical protein CPB85DRAFT_1432124 [Mucidula mucida]
MSVSSLQAWRTHAEAVQSQGQWCYDALWLPLAPFFETHGYHLWVQCSKWTPTKKGLCPLAPPNSHPRVFDGYSYSSPYLLDSDAKDSLQQMSPVICPARAAQNHDVMIRLVAIGASGEQHRRALERLGAPHLAFLPQNHSVPVLKRLVYDNKYYFAVFPIMQDIVSLPDFHDYLEAADYVEQLVEGLDFFHERLVSHGDISKTNVLINLLATRYYYTDFECATCPDEGDESPASVQDNPLTWSDREGVYGRPCAPEVSEPGFYSPFRADIWQLGDMLQTEFEDSPHFEGYQVLFKEMMKDDPVLRPSSKEALVEVRRLMQELHPIRGFSSEEPKAIVQVEVGNAPGVL